MFPTTHNAWTLPTQYVSTYKIQFHFSHFFISFASTPPLHPSHQLHVNNISSFSPPGSSEPARHSTLEHTRYAHTAALSSIRIIPHGPHHSKGTKNTLTTLEYRTSQTSYAKARILRDRPKLQIHINTPTLRAGPPVISHSKRSDSP
jgi:hypothetical protein